MSDRPYQLSYHQQLQRICGRGDHEVMRQMALIPGAVLHTGVGPKYYSFPVNRVTFLCLESIETVDAATDGYRATRVATMSLSNEQVYNIMSLVADKTPIDPSQLLMHQIEYIHMALTTPSVLNASDPGTGKTLMTLIMLYIWESKKAFVTAPPSVMAEWDLQHKLWFEKPHAANGGHTFSGKPLELMRVWKTGGNTVAIRKKAICALRDYEGKHIVISNYEVFTKLVSAVNTYQPDTIVFDESHNLKNPVARRTISALRDLPHIHSIQHIILNTGTPIGNHVGDLWSQLMIVNKDIVILDYNEFFNRYAVTKTVYGPGGVPMVVGRGTQLKKVVGCSDPSTLMRHVEPIYFRASKATCLNLPGKNYRVESIPMSKEASELYELVKNEGEYALGNALSLNGALVVNIRLQQIAGGHAAVFDEEGNKLEVRSLECNKIKWLREWASDHLIPYPSQRAIVWCRFNSELLRVSAMLKELLGSDSVFTAGGQTCTYKELERAKVDFNSRIHGSVQVIVGQIDYLCAGHNLQSGDVNIYFSPTWSYIKRAQSEDRTMRLGRSEPVDYIDLLSAHTIDEVVYEALQKKTSLALRMSPDTVSGRDFSSIDELDANMEEYLVARRLVRK